MSKPKRAPQPIPGSVIATRSASRRSMLRAMGLTGIALGAPSVLAACGGGSDSGSSASKTVKFGINEAAGSGPAYDRLKAMADAYAKKAGVEVPVNAVDHGTFQTNINTYLQGAPDDVFTWFAGYRMDQFAQSGLISDLSDVWPIDGMPESFKQAATAQDGKQYFVPKDYYPWAVFYLKSVWQKNGWQVPTTLEEMRALLPKMKAAGMSPFASAAKEGWEPMGTFDILNMRINGFEYHMKLMRGEESWESAQVKQVFDTWRGLLEFHQPDPLGRTWQEAATALGQGKAGMFVLGTFVVDGLAKQVDDLDFFTFPTLDASIGNDAIDAPIDGFCLATAGKNKDAGKEMLRWLGTAEAADAGNANASALFIAANDKASTAKYTALQKKSVEVVGAAKNIAQFMDRDTRSDYASTVMIPAIQRFLRTPNDVDGLVKSIQQQKASIFGS